MSEHARIFPFLVHDGDDPVAGLRCVACRICEKECPADAIHIVEQRDEKGKVTKHPEVFEIDASVCMGCQICVEVCPFDAIKMDQVFEIATTDRFTALLLDREQLAKPNSYYHTIHPTEAAEVDARDIFADDAQRKQLRARENADNGCQKWKTFYSMGC